MTHEQTKALDTLITAVEKGEFLLGVIKGRLENKAYDAFSGSLDAAKALHEVLLPDLLWEITPAGNVHIRDIQYNKLSKAFVTNNPARAWLIAILKAYRSTLSS